MVQKDELLKSVLYVTETSVGYFRNVIGYRLQVTLFSSSVTISITVLK